MTTKDLIVDGVTTTPGVALPAGAKPATGIKLRLRTDTGNSFDQLVASAPDVAGVTFQGLQLGKAYELSACAVDADGKDIGVRVTVTVSVPGGGTEPIPPPVPSGDTYSRVDAIAYRLVDSAV